MIACIPSLGGGMARKGGDCAADVFLLREFFNNFASPDRI